MTENYLAPFNQHHKGIEWPRLDVGANRPLGPSAPRLNSGFEAEPLILHAVTV